ncbi:MAG: hypothetical protein EHM63_05235 [Actinobacteria bacterium]|nr:MAG: hypothetical protein EHM63_05235 [Actinomycetota bacterium]
MSSDGDEGILNDPDFKAWAYRTRTQVMPMVQDSALVVSLVPKGDADMKFAVELGLAIMLDKPLVIVVEPGQIIAGKLRQVADEIVEWVPGDNNEVFLESLKSIQKRFGVLDADD